MSVLVTALTNRALMEVASKADLEELFKDGRVYKTKMSVDEAKELPLLQNIKQLNPEKGSLMLSTFYITSGEANNVMGFPPFDIVIMDEASQALLAMFAAVKLLGQKTIFVGDPNQLSPVIALNTDRITRRNYHFYVNGITSINTIETIPSYSLTSTYRLTPRAASFTSIFYRNQLQSAQNKTPNFVYNNLPYVFGDILHNQGGPSLIKLDLPLGEKKPQSTLILSTLIVSALLSQKDKLHISVLSSYVDTTKELQKYIFQTIGNHNNLLIDTVSRIQGLTTDVAIYVIPNTGYSFSLDKRLFNVATSRAKRHTISIADSNILSVNSSLIDSEVLEYISKVDSSKSIYITQNSGSDIPLLGGSTTLSIPELNQNEDEIQVIPVDCAEEPNFIKTEVPQIGVKIVGFVDLEKFKPKKKAQSHIYIIDTNVFVEYPNICDKIGTDNQILLSAKVVDELDKLKITLDEDGKRNVEKALRNINRALDSSNVSFEVANTQLLPIDFNKRSPDNLILSAALKYKEENPILLTSDNGLQIKAKGLKIATISLREFLKR